jgi:3-dehydroquinate synthase
VIARGAIESLDAALAERNPSRVALVVDREVARLHPGLERLARRVAAASILVDGGEGAKTAEKLVALWGALGEADLDRGSILLAAGGGTVLDLAGFAASTWHRGIPWIAIPTTLLAMVDAAIGGKTAIDLPAGKNLVGTFHSPIEVIADLAFLDTLPAEELSTGFAEVVKTAVVGDAALLDLIEEKAPALLAREEPALLEAVRRAVAVKTAIVARDPREGGERRLLNFGHTVGHAIERASGYTIPHGRAVALGMLAECAIAEARGLAAPALRERLARVLARFGLPVRLPPTLDVRAIVSATAADKKRSAGVLSMALPREPGRVEVVLGVTPSETTNGVRPLLWPA